MSHVGLTDGTGQLFRMLKSWRVPVLTVAFVTRQMFSRHATSYAAEGSWSHWSCTSCKRTSFNLPKMHFGKIEASILAKHSSQVTPFALNRIQTEHVPGNKTQCGTLQYIAQTTLHKLQ